jgi:hypothetical protein
VSSLIWLAKVYILTFSRAGEMPEHTVRCVRITKKEEKLKRRLTGSDNFFRGLPTSARAKQQRGGHDDKQPSVRLEAFGPLALVTLVDTAIALALFISSIVFGDGMSTLAAIFLTLLSTLTGISNSWTLRLPVRSRADAPAGDTIIRYPNGSFLVVKCEEDIARELFFAPEGVDYLIASAITYRIISLFGTIMLMFGVIALANARLELQFAWAGAYVIINALHWLLAAVPPRVHWDFSDYTVEELCLEKEPQSSNFTEALWKAIAFSQTTDWVQDNWGTARTAVWSDWLEKAKEQVGNVKIKVDKPGAVHDVLWALATWDVTKGATVLETPAWDAKGEWGNIYKEHEKTAPKKPSLLP